jgi:hypothetical protein
MSTTPLTSSESGTPVTDSSMVALEANEAGTYRISQLHGIEPGGTRSGYWNNTPQGRSYFVDVRPISTTVTKPAVIELVRSWRKLNWNANNTTELEVHWQIKNIGADTCDADIYLGYVAP